MNIDEKILNHPFFIGMNSVHAATIAKGAEPMTFETGDIVFREGEPANRFYLIESGRVLLESGTNGKKKVPVQQLRGGDVLGWSWLFPPFSWHFQARALEPTRVLACNGGQLLVACEENHEFGYELMRRIAHLVIQRLQATRRAGLKLNVSDEAARTEHVWDK